LPTDAAAEGKACRNQEMLACCRSAELIIVRKTRASSNTAKTPTCIGIGVIMQRQAHTMSETLSEPQQPLVTTTPPEASIIATKCFICGWYALQYTAL